MHTPARIASRRRTRCATRDHPACSAPPRPAPAGAACFCRHPGRPPRARRRGPRALSTCTGSISLPQPRPTTGLVCRPLDPGPGPARARAPPRACAHHGTQVPEGGRGRARRPVSPGAGHRHCPVTHGDPLSTAVKSAPGGAPVPLFQLPPRSPALMTPKRSFDFVGRSRCLLLSPSSSSRCYCLFS